MNYEINIGCRLPHRDKWDFFKYFTLGYQGRSAYFTWRSITAWLNSFFICLISATLLMFFKWANPGLFLFYFCSFLVTISIQIEKSIDGVLGIRTWGRRMVDADKTTELWRPPQDFANVEWTIKILVWFNPKQWSKRSAVQWYLPLQSKLVFSDLTHGLCILSIANQWWLNFFQDFDVELEAFLFYAQTMILANGLTKHQK